MQSSFLRPSICSYKQAVSYGFPQRFFSCSNPAEINYIFESIAVSFPQNHVYHVQLNRPKKKNAMNMIMWEEMRECFSKISLDENCRCVLLSGSSDVFTAGLDLQDMPKVLLGVSGDDSARKAWKLRNLILHLQKSISSVEKCTKPVIAAVSGPCIGAGVDLISACDIRYCSSDSYFQVKEVDIGLAADVGTLQRLPSAIGNRSLVSELAFTGRKLFPDEAQAAGLLSAIFPCKRTLLEASIDLAASISAKSPVAVQGTKHNLIYSRDHSVSESLDYIATWNMAMMQTDDIKKSTLPSNTKPEFSDL